MSLELVGREERIPIYTSTRFGGYGARVPVASGGWRAVVGRTMEEC